MGLGADLTIRDVRRGLGHYKPVALAIAGIVAVVTLTPGGLEQRAETAESAFSLDVETAEPEDDAAADQEVSAGVAPDPELSSPAEPSSPSFDVPAPSPSFSGSRSDSTDSSESFDAGGPSFTPTPSGTSGDAEDEEPLEVAAAAWASASAGTPLAAAGVPEGTLPVGNRFARLDKASFVRLAGGGSELVLVEDEAGHRAPPTDEAPTVQACRIAEPGWEEAEAQSFDEAPTWDDAACAVGTRGEDGTWVFDLSALGVTEGDAGVALVPAPEAPFDFQVAFARSGG